ncbi:MAG: hypothetical protein O3A51_12875, partial [Verrucomicrobia bacterium]|nr:hypothetical protein [Verrucomicrobiota bacterium]
RMMALSKALSGGPIYLSDNPRKIVADHVMPLCDAKGELLRPLAPAAPLPESLLIDPFAEKRAYRVIAPLANGCAAIALYNFTEPERPIRASIAPKDYRQATIMVQPEVPAWRIPKEGLLLYDWMTRTARRLSRRQSFDLPGFGDRYVLLCPIRSGWATIGRIDKFLSPAAIEVIQVAPESLILRVPEHGPLCLWRADGRPKSTAYAFTRLGKGGLWLGSPRKSCKSDVVTINLA